MVTKAKSFIFWEYEKVIRMVNNLFFFLSVCIIYLPAEGEIQGLMTIQWDHSSRSFMFSQETGGYNFIVCLQCHLLEKSGIRVSTCGLFYTLLQVHSISERNKQQAVISVLEQETSFLNLQCDKVVSLIFLAHFFLQSRFFFTLLIKTSFLNCIYSVWLSLAWLFKSRICHQAGLCCKGTLGH